MKENTKDIQQLSVLFHEFSDEDIVSAQRSTEAFANEVYDVTDSAGQRYFLKILKTQLPEAVATEAEMQQRLAKAGLSTPFYLEIKPGSHVGISSDTRFLLSRYIPGVSPKLVTQELIESFGATLAILHDSLKDVSIAPNSMQWLNRDRVRADFDGYDGNAKEDISKLLTAGQAIFDADLPRAVIHGDLWMNNVFAAGDRITTVFDLETAEHTVRIIDLARTYTSLAFNSSYTSEEIFDGLESGYNSVSAMPLTRQERDYLGSAVAYVTGACATWHAVHGTRYLEPYIKLGNEILAKSAK